MTPLLEGRDLSAGYGGQPVVRGLDFTLEAGETVTVLGPNGAGKTTSVLTLAGAVPVISGELRWKGTPTRASLDRRARDGMSLVREGRSVITGLNVRDNLRLGCPIASALRFFPELEEHLDRPAGLLSGGQQQMLTLARALGRDPELLIADELSLGLAPLIVRRLFSALRDAAERGVGVVLVEQHARQALELADRGYVLRRGQLELEGSATELLRQHDEIEGAYLSHGEEPAEHDNDTRKSTHV
jgi:ABC-type branched-subunit amino acid transport system ATPase component